MPGLQHKCAGLLGADFFSWLAQDTIIKALKRCSAFLQSNAEIVFDPGVVSCLPVEVTFVPCDVTPFILST